MREKNVLDSSPTGLELGIPLLALLVRVAKRVVLSSPERRLRSVEAQALDSVGMRSGEQDAERASLAPAQHMGLIHPRSVHHRPRVLHSLGPRWSKRTTRAKAASPSHHRTHVGSSQSSARCENQPGIISISAGPSPTT